MWGLRKSNINIGATNISKGYFAIQSKAFVTKKFLPILSVALSSVILSVHFIPFLLKNSTGPAFGLSVYFKADHDVKRRANFCRFECLYSFPRRRRVALF